MLLAALSRRPPIQFGGDSGRRVRLVGGEFANLSALRILTRRQAQPA